MKTGIERVLGAALALGLLAACQTGARGPRAATSSLPSGPRVEVRAPDDRPAVGLVERDGDPKGALALALAHDFGADASSALAPILAARLRRAGFSDVVSRPHALGIVIATLATPADAPRFVNAATRALSEPIRDAERVRDTSATKIPRPAADAAVRACAGELGPGGASAPEPPDAAALESFRVELHRAQAAAFAAVGPRPLLDALDRAVAGSEKWPRGAGPNDPWPDADSLTAGPAVQRTLSLAYRVADAARALEVADNLATPGSVLATRLAQSDGGFALERVVGVSRVRGGCLRIDVRARGGEARLRPLDVARAISIVDEEARPLLDARKGASRVLDDAVLRPTHPLEAASAAAWRALATRLEGGVTRRAVAWLAPGQGEGAGELERALAGLEAARQKGRVERRSHLETGQGELWALVASPCGTRSESADDAGTTALLVRTLAQKRNGLFGVSIEPWVTPSGVGLLAHAPRAGSSETPDELARRVGDALGRALIATRLAGGDVAEAKSELLDEIGPAGQKGYFTLLDAASAGHPARLDPRGTWRAVSAALTTSLDARRRLFASGPLRLALVSNHARSQDEQVALGLERWLRPARSEASACPQADPSAVVRGERTVEVSRPDYARTYLALSIAGSEHGPIREAEWTVFLANREGGWLEQKFPASGAVHVRAAALGTRDSAALVFEIDAPAAEQSTTLAALRALLQTLSRGSATEADAELARRQFERIALERSLDPRGRIVDLWRGAAASSADLASLRRFHASLGNAPEILVQAKTRE
ncbi:MAG: hypothetical protein U0263_14360 [Polyangiaceae bacterium]